MPGLSALWTRQRSKWPVIVGVFVGYVWALLALGLVGLVLDILGVVTWAWGPRGDDWLAGPFEPDGPWSLFTDAVVAFTVLAATSGFVVWALSYRVHRRVSWSVAFVALGVTGYAPYFFFEGRLRVSGLVGLLLSAGLIRWFGIPGARPADVLPRLEDRVAAAGLARREGRVCVCRLLGGRDRRRRRVRCHASASDLRRLSLIRVRYTVFGQKQSELLRLDPPIAARCSRGRRP